MKRLLHIHLRKLIVLLGILVCVILLALKFEGLYFLTELVTTKR